MVATQAVRRMRGFAQAQLVQMDDLSSWVVKFTNNTLGPRILANELIASQLAAAIGLSVPESAIVDVPQAVAKHMYIHLPRRKRERCQPGRHFGSRLVLDNEQGQVLDCIPQGQLDQVENLAEFAGILCLDKWTANCDGRQAVFSIKPSQRHHRAHFIDQGFCFNAEVWSFPDKTLRGVYARRSVYRLVTGWQSFEPWLSRIEAISPDLIWKVAESVPREWYGGDHFELKTLVHRLIARRFTIRSLIESFRDSLPGPFPLWGSDQP